MVRSIDLRGTVEVAKHSGSDFDDLKCETHYFRWILMIDTQANGAFPNLTDVFEENPTGGDQFDIYNSSGKLVYKILMDKVLRINELTLDGILRQIDGMQPLDYNTSKSM